MNVYTHILANKTMEHFKMCENDNSISRMENIKDAKN